MNRTTRSGKYCKLLLALQCGNNADMWKLILAEKKKHVEKKKKIQYFHVQ